MKNQDLWMIMGCALPILLIFLLPSFWNRRELAAVIFILLKTLGMNMEPIWRRANVPSLEGGEGYGYRGTE